MVESDLLHVIIPDYDPEQDDIIAHEVIDPPEPATKRSSARRTALQILYELDITNHHEEEVIARQLRSVPASTTQQNYVQHLVTGVQARQTDLDEILQEYASDWPIDQVSVIDRNILRLALFEFGLNDKVPVSVSIDECVQLASIFGAENAPGFVNGVLGALDSDLPKIRERLDQINPAPTQ